jgi:hypothetical protein
LCFLALSASRGFGLCCFVAFGFEGLSGFGFDGFGFLARLGPLVYTACVLRVPLHFLIKYITYIYMYKESELKELKDKNRNTGSDSKKFQFSGTNTII